MPTLDEVPGALERPGGCRIGVSQSEDRRETTITIPPRPAPVWLIVAACILFINLLVVFVTGLALLIGHHSILFMTQIAPGDLPAPMRRYISFYALGWAALLALGVWVLATILRPFFYQETLTISPDGLTQHQSLWGRRDQQIIPHSEVRGFHLKQDPQRLTPSILTIQGRGEEWAVAEYVTEADREWLASVGNALLRDL